MSVHKEHMPSDVELHYKTISYTNNKYICNTNIKLFMILYNCNFMMYCMQDFYLGVGGWGSECTSPGPASSPSSLEESAPLHNQVGDCIQIWS